MEDLAARLSRRVQLSSDALKAYREAVELEFGSEVDYAQLVNTYAVANKQDYIARLQLTIQHLHNCGAVHRETVPVREVFKGNTLWNGDVEVLIPLGIRRLNGVTAGPTANQRNSSRSWNCRWWIRRKAR